MQVDDSQGDPFTVAAQAPRRTAHVLADTLEASLPSPEGEPGPEGTEGDNHVPCASQQPAATPEQALEGGPSLGGAGGGPSAHDTQPQGAEAVPEAGEATLLYEVAGAAEEPQQAAETAPEQAPASVAAEQHTTEAARPSTQKPEQAMPAWTPVVSPDGWRAKKRSKPEEGAQSTQLQGKLLAPAS